MDERLANRKDVNTKEVAAKAARGDERTSVDDELESAKERRKMFREFTQEALPSPPAKPGWHFVWLSTTNQYDPIYKRIRMGYSPVKAEDLPGFDHYRSKSGEFEGCVSVNEMILFKIPQEIYQEIMEEYHFNMPNEEEGRIKANAASAARDSSGKNLGGFDKDDEGFSSLTSKVNAPIFN